MFTKLADATLRHPWFTILFFVAVTAFFAVQLPKMEVDPEMTHQMPDDMPARLSLDRIEELFGGTDMLIVTFSTDDVLAAETLTRVEKLSDGLERMTELDKVFSPFTLKDIHGKDGEMIVNPAVEELPKTDAERDALRRSLKDNDQVYGRVISKDFKHAAIIGFLNADATDSEVLAKLDELLVKYPGPEAVHIGGAPYIRSNIGRDIGRDMRTFMPIGLLVMLVLFYFCFRQLRGVLLPFIITVMAVIVSMGLIPLMGWKIMVVTVILPVMLIAVANDYGIHMVARYQEDNVPGNRSSRRELARKGMVALAKPVLVTGVTTIAGLLCLTSHILIPAEQMGYLASAGVAFALLASLFFLPALFSVLPKAEPVQLGDDEGESRRKLLDRLLVRLAHVIVCRPKSVVASLVAVALVVSGGVALLKVDTNSVNYYPEGAPVREGANLVNDHFGGNFAVSVVAEGDIKSPKVMQAIDDLHRHMESHPNVDVVTSISEIMRDMHEVMHDDDPAYYAIPDSRDLIAQYFLLYSMSGEPDDFDKLIDFPYQHANITARVNDNNSDAISSVVDHAKKYVAEHPDGPFTVVGGMANVFADMVDEVVRGQIMSLSLSLLAIFILVGLLFRSVTAGLMACVPLMLAMGILFGLMGLFHIELNVTTAMLSSIMIGVGVDYTIHFLWRYKEERFVGRSARESVIETLTTTGRGIIFNALSVIVGFAVLMISSFQPVQFFGFLVFVSIGACLVGAVALLPAAILLIRPRFLEPAERVAVQLPMLPNRAQAVEG